MPDLEQETETRAATVARLVAQFDHRDPALSGEVLAQVYDGLLQREGLSYSAAHGGMYLAVHRSEIREAEKSCPAFSSAAGVLHPSPADHPRNIPIEFDPPEHTAYRELFAELLNVTAVREYRPELRRIAKELLETFVRQPDGSDFVEFVARPMPLLVIGTLLGWDRATNNEVVECASRILETYGTPDALEWFAKLDALATNELNLRKQERREDYLSKLIDTDFGGRRLSDAELTNIIRVFIFAGFETTAHAAASLIWHLAQHPEMQQQLREHPELIEGAVEEGLRMFSPVQNMFRTVTTPSTLGGKELKAGDRVALMYAAANRDPEVFSEPDSFDPTRTNFRGHVTFGFAVHFCVGAHLARAELRILLELLAEYPTFALAGEPHWTPHLMMGQMFGVEHLPLRFVRNE